MADLEENEGPFTTIGDISEELECTHLAHVPQVLRKLEDIQDTEDEMRLAEGKRLSKKYDSVFY
ncbi:uncharacterized protein LOC110182978 [Drosophila serrata]|uniref:uncharacterized protein LOC110179262 n=1 Tax=Drosophila serrata TaxID=7274 RepID=UPI000A1D002C|nr:uncharacterized protein LOC110179262 [Drosophila serrata]XP_020806830.1 uncharacterized protein LOC110182978 [Drosophila serrata]